MLFLIFVLVNFVMMESKDSSVSTNIYQELDSMMGTMTRIPWLLNAEGYGEWKFNFEKYMRTKDSKAWKFLS